MTGDEWIDLPFVEPMRKRPAMYLGWVDARGPFQLALCALGNAVSATLDDERPEIRVTVADCGRMLTVRDSRSTAGAGEASTHAALFRRILAAPTARDWYWRSDGDELAVLCGLSEQLAIRLRVRGRVYEQRYSRGVVQGPTVSCECPDEDGVSFTFGADPEIFTESALLDEGLVTEWLREQAALHPGMRTYYENAATGTTDVCHYPAGIADHVAHLNRLATGRCPEPAFFCSGTEAGIRITVALQYCDRPAPLVLAFANLWKLHDGGRHVGAFQVALRQGVADAAEATGLSPSPVQLRVRSGLTAVVRAEMDRPELDSATLAKLTSHEAGRATKAVFGAAFGRFLRDNAEVSRRIVERAMQAGS